MQTVFVLSTRSKKSLLGTWKLPATVGLMLFAALFCRPAMAQGIQQFVGHIGDPSGAAVAGASVTIHNEGTGVNIVVKATGAGDYTAAYLKPGTYTITAKLAGFKEVSKTHISLEIDQTSKIDFTLPVGEVTDTVTVMSEGSQIELAKADRGEIIGTERVAELPLDGRQVLDLFTLSPGTQNSGNPIYTRQQDNVSQNLYANGITQVPVSENIDGSTNDNSGNDNGSPYVGYNPPVDAIGAFKVVLNGYDASYGRSAGASVDVSLKSGTNTIHGVVYDFVRRNYLDANSWNYDYSHAGVRPDFRRDDFGVQLEGPVMIPHLYNGRDKTFFMLEWEQSYENQPSTSANIYSIPNPQWLMGNFAGAQYFDTTTQTLMPLIIYDPLSPLTTFVDVDGKTKTEHSPFPGNVIPTSCVPIPPATACSSLNPIGTALAQYYGTITPNYNPGPGYAPYSNNYYAVQQQTYVNRNGVVKIDQNFGPRDRGTLRWGGFESYNVANQSTFAANNPANVNDAQFQPVELQFQVLEVHTFSPNLLLDNRLIVSTYKQGLIYGLRGNYLSQEGFSSNFINSVYTNNMVPYVTSTSNLGGNSFIPLSSSTNGRENIAHELAYQPSLTYVHGRHTARVGYDMRLIQYATTVPGQNNQFGFTPTFTGQLGPGYAYAPGLTAGNSIASLLVGDPSTGSTGFQSNPFYSQHYFAMWAQDDWKVTSKLTLNVGIRYDLLGARTERHNYLNGPFNPTANTGISATGIGSLAGGLTFQGVNGTPRGAYSMNLTNIQPRFGAAYAVSNKTSLRLGFGEFFINDESLDGTVGFSASTAYNNSLNNGITPYGNLANPYPSLVQKTGSSLGPLTSFGTGITFVNPNYRIPSVWDSSVSVSQLLTHRDTIDINYSSSRAYGLPSGDNIDHVSAAYYAQCDVERGGNPALCGASGAGQIANPFLGIAAFQGSSAAYYGNATVSSSVLTQPFPQFTSVTENNLNLLHIWYNSLQLVVSHNASRDLNLHFAYTWSKDMQAGNIIDTVNRVYGRNLTTIDSPTIMSLSGVYYLPVGRGRTFLGKTNRVVDAAVGGWEFSFNYSFTQGHPWTPGSNFEIMSPLTVNKVLLPFDGTHAYHRLQGVSPCVGYRDASTGLIDKGPAYINAGCTSFAIVRQESYPSGNFAADYSVMRNIVYSGVRLPATQNFDISLSKRFAYSERVNLQLRLDAINALNHPNFAYGNSYSNDPTNANWGTISEGPSSPGNPSRELQISGKLFF